MKYIIENRVIFCPDDGTFWQVEHEDEKVILPPIVSRLMTLLLEEQGKVLMRDEIMDRVWTVYGLEPSGNSLNQYISNIRRHFQNSGIGDEIIKTIPRIGFVLNADFKIEKDINSAVVETVVMQGIPPAAEFKPTYSLKRVYGALVLSSTIILGMPFIFTRGVEILNESRIEINPFSIGPINQCDVRTVKMDNASRSPNTLAVAQKILDKNNINCLNHEVVFLFIQSSVLHNEPGRIFISVCENNGHKFSFCENQAFNNWL